MFDDISRSTINAMKNYEMLKKKFFFFWQIFLGELYSFEI